MKIKFLRNVTVDAFKNGSDATGVYDILLNRNKSYEVWEIRQISPEFSTVYLATGEVLCDVRNDSFVVTE